MPSDCHPRRRPSALLQRAHDSSAAVDRCSGEQSACRGIATAARQSVRSAYTSRIKQLIGDDKAKKFDGLYLRRSNFLHDGNGRGTLGDAADAALEIGLELLLADIAQSARNYAA